MSTPEEKIKTLLINDELETEKKTKNMALASLEHITETQNQLALAKQSLNDIFDAMIQNPSMFSQAAIQWGELPLWSKILGGGVIIVPTLALGIAFNLPALLTMSGVTIIGYTATGLLLNDHNNCSIQVIEHLKQGILSLADLLTLTIDALDNIRLKFEEEINRFVSENVKLTQNITNLADQVDSLSTQVDQFIKTNEALRETKEQLEEKTKILEHSVKEHVELLQKTQLELIGATTNYNESQKQLSEKVVELRTVRTEMAHDVEKAKAIGNTLQAAVHNLSSMVLGDEQRKAKLLSRMDEFLANKEAGFDKITDRLSDTERELVLVKNEIKKLNEENLILLERQENQVVRLERLNRNVSSIEVTPQQAQSEYRTSKGFFKLQTKNPIPLSLNPIVVI